MASLYLKEEVDYKDLYTMYEHKKLMRERLICMEKELHMPSLSMEIDYYNKIAGESYGLLLSHLMNMRRGIKSNKSIFVNKTQELLNKERIVLQNVLNQL